ncbi:MAG TPA: lytic transglycosylase domain-containing protein [Blastocatellia bacterium]|nr:lytic transglycosylase domain-containing protein [Blastocatellia bacterium]
MQRINLLLCVLLISSVFAIDSQAATVGQKSQKSSATKTDQSSTAASNKQAVDDYKASVQKLADIYDKNVQTLTDKVATMKDLFDKGLISRKEYENSQLALEQAQREAKGAHDQYTSADSLLVTNTNININGSSDLTTTNWTTGNATVDSYIKKYSGMFGVDPFLVYCVITQESGFNKNATSPKGAQGLMQLMPDTAARYGVTNAYDPEQNIKAGTHYLKDLLTMFNGNHQLALAGYNAGEGAVMKYGNKIPPYSETQEYVKSISSHYLNGAKVGSQYETVPAVKTK